MKNKSILISFLIVLIITLCSCFAYWNNLQKTKKIYEQIQTTCKDNETAYSYCANFLNEDYKILDAYTIFSTIFVDEGLSILPIIGPFIIIIPAIWTIHKEIKNRYIKGYTLRNSYKNYLKHLFLNAYKSIWIIPVIALIVFIISIFISNWNFDYTYALNNSYATFEEQYLANFKVFFPCYLLNLTFFSIFYANLGLFFAKRNKSIIISILEAYLTFIGIEIINEVLITGIIFYKILNIPIQSILNIYDIYSYRYVFGIFPYLLVGFTYAISSFIIVYLSYRNKEKNIIESEMLLGG